MLIVRGDAQTLPSELNPAATGEVWFDPILPKTDGVDVGAVVFSPSGRTVWHQHEHGQLRHSALIQHSTRVPCQLVRRIRNARQLIQARKARPASVKLLASTVTGPWRPDCSRAGTHH
jgi:hypothetical protein